MIGERAAPETALADGDVIAELKEWIGRGSVPLDVAKRALALLELWRNAVTAGKSFADIRRELRGSIHNR